MKRQSRQTKPKSADDSPTRVRTTRASPARSPGRPRLNAKSPKSKSPSRKSPSRKSPSRKSTSKAEPILRSPSTRKSKKTTVDTIDSIKDELVVKVIKLPNNDHETKNGIESNDIHSRLRERRPKLESYIPPKSSRSRDLDYENLLRKAHTTELPKSEVSIDNINNDLSEDDTPYTLPKARKLITPVRELKSKIPQSQKWLFSSFTLISTIFAFFITLACSGQQCKFTSMPNLQPYSKIEAWFTLRSLWLMLGYVSIVFSFSFFPYFGKECIFLGNKRKFSANGFFIFMVIFIITFSIEKYMTSIADIVHEDFVQLCLLGIILSIVFAIIMFIKGRHSTEENRNPRADGEDKLYEFCVGRQISPFSGKINYKLSFFRIGIIGQCIFNFIWLYRSLKIGDLPALTTESLKDWNTYIDFIQAFEISNTLISYAFIEIAYGLTFLYYEEYNSSMMEFMSEGVGLFLIFGYFFYPFSSPLITKLILDQNIQLSNQTLILILIVYLIGYYINFASNNEKNMFRKNPLDPRVAHLQTLPTLTGNRLIVSGWWGFVRHPNYLGDLICQSLLFFVTYNNIMLYFAILEVVLLVHRAIRDGKRCNERYGVAWTRYCQKVPYTLIPRVW